MQKERLTEGQFFLVINGPSCGGKSSVSTILTEKYGGIFNANNDVVKWLISDYDPLTHKVIVQKIVLEATRAALTNNFSIIKEGAFWSEPQDYTNLAQEMNIPLFVANVEAPWDVLMTRFEKRVEAKAQGVKKIANVDPHKFKNIYDTYIATKVETPLQFDSSLQSPEHIAETIVKYIKEQLA